MRASAGLARRRAARRAARPPCGGRKARRHARRLAARAGEGRLSRAGALSVAARCSTAVPASRKVREPRLRACGGPWGSVRLRRGSERPAGKAVRGAHHRALDAKESGGRRARSRSSASNEPVRSAAAVTVAVRRHAHIRGPSRYEAGIGGATLDMRRCTLAPRGLLGRCAGRDFLLVNKNTCGNPVVSCNDAPERRGPQRQHHRSVEVQVFEERVDLGNDMTWQK